MTDRLQVLNRRLLRWLNSGAALAVLFIILVVLWIRLGEAPPPPPECKVVVLAEAPQSKSCPAAFWKHHRRDGVAVQDEAGHVWEICTRAPVGTSLLTQCEWRR